MKAIVATCVLLVTSAGYVRVQAQTPRADSKRKDSKIKEKSQSEADAVADKILAETSQVVPIVGMGRRHHPD